MFNFSIDKTKFKVGKKVSNNFVIKSNLKNYRVVWDNDKISKSINPLFKDKNNIFLIDRRVYKLYFKKMSLNKVFLMNASENLKNVNQAIKFTDFLIKQNATKQNNVIVIGGGIIQDVAAFACAMFKRGIPWTLIPTTLLSITDSCIGAKTGLNYGSTKNIHALFSAPQKIIINLEFIKTLRREDIISGIGESLKLSIIGGTKSLEIFNKNINAAVKNNSQISLKKIIINSLYIKKEVIEFDEFEFNHRRSLNYGHSVGHALEILSNYKIPHGISIIFGILMENEISYETYGMKRTDLELIKEIVRKIDVPIKFIKKLKDINYSGISNILTRDKKTIGKILKLAVPTKELGNLEFCNQKINLNIEKKLNKISNKIIKELS